MHKFESIRVRLISAFAMALLLLVLSNLYAINRMKALTAETIKLYEHPFTVSNSVLEAETNLIKIHRDMKDLVLTPDPSQFDVIVLRVDEHEQQALRALKVAREQFLGDEEEVDSLFDAVLGWKPIREEVIALMRTNRQQEAAELTKGKGALYVDRLEKQINVLREFAFGKAIQFLNNSKAIAANSIRMTSIYILGACLIGIFIVVYTTNTITAAIGRLSQWVGEVSTGNLTVEIPKENRRDEIGQLVRQFDEMISNLRNQTREVIEATNILAKAATEISTTTTQLATSTSETATSVNETTTTVEEVKQTTQMANQHAQSVSDTASQAVQVSQAGQRAVTQTSDGMGRIRQQMESIAESIVHLSEQSQAIGKIISTVDGLSDQSNLLAVNAAIEANKAGEHGKGFVVVAQQINNLADQSKHATQQVREILEEITRATSAAVMATENGSKAVEIGFSLSNEAGDAIQSLAAAIDDASKAAIQIAASIQQQSAGVNQVTMAMENINTATVQNMDGTRQLEQSAVLIQQLGQDLKTTVERYKV